MAFDFLEADAAEGDPMVKRHIITDDCRLTDDDAHAMVDKDSATKAGSRVDLNPGKKAGDL